MHPIERLRYVARSGGVDVVTVALEAADALADLAREPMALVPACRRLLDAQPLNGPLWWLAASILAAPNPAAAALACAELLEADPTPDELAGALSSSACVAAEAAPQVLAGLSERPDCVLRVVGSPYELRGGLARLGGGAAGGPDALGYEVEELDDALDGARLALVEALAGGSGRFVCSPAGAALARGASEAGVPLWIVAGRGRMLPEVLFARVAAKAPFDELLSEVAIDALVGPEGVLVGSAAERRVDCRSVAALERA